MFIGVHTKMRYKVVIGYGKEGYFKKALVTEPEFFISLEEVREYVRMITQKVGEAKIWFIRVWEQGKEDYHDMGNSWQ